MCWAMYVCRGSVRDGSVIACQCDALRLAWEQLSQGLREGLSYTAGQEAGCSLCRPSLLPVPSLFVPLRLLSHPGQLVTLKYQPHCHCRRHSTTSSGGDAAVSPPARARLQDADGRAAPLLASKPGQRHKRWAASRLRTLGARSGGGGGICWAGL